MAFGTGSGRYASQIKKMNSNVEPPGGSMNPGYTVDKNGKLVKLPKQSVPAPPPLGSGGRAGTISAVPKPIKTNTPTTSLVAQNEGNAVAAPSKTGTKAPPLNQNSAVPLGGGTTVARTQVPRAVSPAIDDGSQGTRLGYAAASTPATNVPGSLPTDDVMDRMNGFASRYDPSQINQIMDDPNIVLEDVLKSLGFGVGNARLAEMGPYAENMLNLAGMMQMSGSMGGADQADETMLNTIAELMSNGMGQGGQSVDYQNALGMLMKPQGAMDEYLFGINRKDPATGEMIRDPTFGLSQQAQALAPMFQAATQGVNPFTQRAMASAYRGAEHAAQGALARGQNTGADPRILNYLKTALGGIIPGT